jgi:hypothetical protein
VVHALLVQAQLTDDGRVMFLVPMGEQVPAVFAKLDGKEARAIGADLKPLTADELKNRLHGWTAAVAVQAEFAEPDAFFLKVLNERSVVFVLPKKVFAPMAKASESRRAPGEPLP